MIKDIFNFIKIVISWLLSKFIKEYDDCWLICERGSDARDNGYFFFEYLTKKSSNINAIYVIDKNSPDYEKVSMLGKCIQFNSINHGVAYFKSKYLVSTHQLFCKPNWRGFTLFEEKIGKARGKKIFLQHGITKDYMNSLLFENLKADLFICGAKPEYNFVINKLGYNHMNAKYTGFARFDRLFNNQVVNHNKTILLMPTWRNYLNSLNDDDFVKTSYYLHYTSLLKNKDLNKYLSDNDIKLIFYPHYEIQKRIYLFNELFTNNIIVADFANYDVQNLLISCDMLITDYSSVFFDVAFMQKKVIYYHFDYDEYRKNHYAEGYFNYEQGFGPIAKDEKNLVTIINETFDKPLEKKYLNRINNFFEFRDNHNSDRIYYEIVNNLGDDD